MRSTQLVLFLVLLNVGAGIAAAAIPADISPQTGGQNEIDEAENDVEDRDFGRIPGSELVAAFFSVMEMIEDVRGIVFYGPEMLVNLGAPRLLVTGFETVLAFVVAFDIGEVVTGRILS